MLVPGLLAAASSIVSGILSNSIMSVRISVLKLEKQRVIISLGKSARIISLSLKLDFELKVACSDVCRIHGCKFHIYKCDKKCGWGRSETLKFMI